MKTLLAVVAVASLIARAADPLTLDPDMMEEAKRRVFGGEGYVQSSPAPDDKDSRPMTDVARWEAAMEAAGSEMHAVLLLALLQKLNPSKPMEAHAAAYAAALRLHVMAAAGNKEACLQLSMALSTGVLPCGLAVCADARLAEKCRARAF